jgi:hypothetical protein
MSKREEVMESLKPKRVPMGRRQVLKLTGITDDANFYYRWMNDVGERLYHAQEAGYEFVQKDGLQAGDQNVESARGTESIMKKGVGLGITAYLMRIPIEIWREDQTVKQKLVDSMEADIRKPKDGITGKVEITTNTK